MLINDVTRRIGGSIPLDGKASWAPVIPGVQQPINCYLIDKKDTKLLIDTGIAAHRQLVLDQVLASVPPQARFVVSLTRTEPECSGNLIAIHRKRPITEFVSGGTINLLDDYGEEADDVVRTQFIPDRSGKPSPFGEPPLVYHIGPLMRLLATNWVIDPTTKTLFSSDTFGHTVLSRPGDAPLITSLSQDTSTYESVRDHILAKYWWIPKAYTRVIRDWLRDFFVKWEIETIAPSRGCALQGRALVDKHVELLDRVLKKESAQS